MTKTEFVILIKNLQDFNNKQHNHASKMAKLLGSDSAVFYEFIDSYIDRTVHLFGVLMNDTESIDWLFWESLNSPINDNPFVVVDGKEMEGTPENIYDLICETPGDSTEEHY